MIPKTWSDLHKFEPQFALGGSPADAKSSWKDGQPVGGTEGTGSEGVPLGCGRQGPGVSALLPAHTASRTGSLAQQQD